MPAGAEVIASSELLVWLEEEVGAGVTVSMAPGDFGAFDAPEATAVETEDGDEVAEITLQLPSRMVEAVLAFIQGYTAPEEGGR